MCLDVLPTEWERVREPVVDAIEGVTEAVADGYLALILKPSRKGGD